MTTKSGNVQKGSPTAKSRDGLDRLLKQRRHPIFDAMKGTIVIAPGVDLTEPAMPEWADLIDEKYGRKS